MKRLLLSLSLFGVLLFSAPANAMTVFDPTNYAENLLAAQESVKQTQHMIQQLTTQIQQYERMLKDAMSLPDFVSGDLASQIRDIDNFKNRITGILANIQGGGGGTGRLDEVIREFYAPSDYKANITLFADRDSLGTLGYSELAGHELTKGYADATFQLMSDQLESMGGYEERYQQVLSAGQGAEGQMQVMQAQLEMMSLILEKMGEIHHAIIAATCMNAARNETIVQQEVKNQILGGILMGESEFFQEQIREPAKEYRFFE